ncbi:MAG: GAF domain-containing protein, partial [Deltaproteobacteria bacterium]|nr:GAF domain-containing protein [Deltaproteobacteria bacterium]
MEASPKLPEVAGQLALSYKTLEVINALLQLSLQDLPLSDILQHTLNLLVTIPWIGIQSRGAIFLVENQAGMLTLKAQIGMDSSIQTACSRIPFGHCLCGLAAATRKIQFTPSHNEHHRPHLDQVPPHGHYCIPIMLGERLLGVMNLSVQPDHVRSEKEEEFLTSAAHALAGILARQEAEEARNRSEQEFKLFLKNVPAIVFKGYADGSVDLFNDKVEEMTGYPK